MRKGVGALSTGVNKQKEEKQEKTERKGGGMEGRGERKEGVREEGKEAARQPSCPLSYLVKFPSGRVTLTQFLESS